MYTGAFLPPLLEHRSTVPTLHSPEAHYYPLLTFPARHILLHTHVSGPFIAPPSAGLDLVFYTSGDAGCALNKLQITLDWWSTLGRVGTRYASSAGAWAVGVVAVVVWDALSQIPQGNDGEQ